MTDILDEILAFTEGYQAKRSTAQPRVSLPSQVQAPLPLGPPFAPSPRGIQEDLNTFGLLRHSYNPKNELVPVYQASDPEPQQDAHDEAAAAVAAAISTCIRPTTITTPTRLTRPPPIITTTTTLPEHSPVPIPTTHAHQPSSAPKPMRATARPRHPVSYQSVSASVSGMTAEQSEINMFTMSHDVNVGSKRTAENAQLDDESDKNDKKVKGEVAVVMPPSAKSILERREKAIREGRRKDAKLTEAERRILRRLRNRESAERCRLRRVQQAALLERKIESMQIENERLVAQAEEYQKTIQRLERVIEEFSGQKNA